MPITRLSALIYTAAAVTEQARGMPANCAWYTQGCKYVRPECRQICRKEQTYLAAVLKALLDDVVAKHVLHEGEGVRLHLLIHCHDLLWLCFGQFLLDEATAMLISAEVKHEALDVLQQLFRLSKLIGCWLFRLNKLNGVAQKVWLAGWYCLLGIASGSTVSNKLSA